MNNNNKPGTFLIEDEHVAKLSKMAIENACFRSINKPRFRGQRGSRCLIRAMRVCDVIASYLIHSMAVPLVRGRKAVGVPFSSYSIPTYDPASGRHARACSRQRSPLPIPRTWSHSSETVQLMAKLKPSEKFMNGECGGIGVGEEGTGRKRGEQGHWQ